jgi:Holliday junction resolvase
MADKHEQYIRDKFAELYPNARIQPGSGNQPGSPNDIVAGPWHVECKMTNRGSMVVQFAWLARVRKLAMQFGKRSLLALRFGNDDYFVLRAADFYAMLGEDENRV